MFHRVLSHIHPKNMVIKKLGLPAGILPVVVTFDLRMSRPFNGSGMGRGQGAKRHAGDGKTPPLGRCDGDICWTGYPWRGVPAGVVGVESGVLMSRSHVISSDPRIKPVPA
jgi:hypothetical protein